MQGHPQRNRRWRCPRTVEKRPPPNSHHIAGDLRTNVQKLKDTTPVGVLLGSGKLATELDRLDLIDECKFLVQPRMPATA